MLLREKIGVIALGVLGALTVAYIAGGVATMEKDTILGLYWFNPIWFLNL